MWDLKGRSARHPLRRIGGWIAPLLLAGSGVLLWMPLSHAQDRRRVKEPIVAAPAKICTLAISNSMECWRATRTPLAQLTARPAILLASLYAGEILLAVHDDLHRAEIVLGGVEVDGIQPG